MPKLNLSLYGQYIKRGISPSLSLEPGKVTAVTITLPEEEHFSTSLKYEIEVEANNNALIVTTKDTLARGREFLTRTQFNGLFAFDLSGNLVSGSVSSVYFQRALNSGASKNQSQRWAIDKLVFAVQRDWSEINKSGLAVDFANYSAVQTTQFKEIYYPDYWQFDPFKPKLLKDASANTISSSSPVALPANKQNVLLTGSGNISGKGNSLSNVITGNSGNNILDGLGGKDLLTGLAGKDTFRISALKDSLLGAYDRITDFTIGSDKIQAPSTRVGLVSNVGNVSSLNATDISSKLTATSFKSNGVAVFSFGSQTFVAINDPVAGFDAKKDAIVEVTGYSGGTIDQLLTGLF